MKQHKYEDNEEQWNWNNGFIDSFIKKKNLQFFDNLINGYIL